MRPSSWSHRRSETVDESSDARRQMPALTTNTAWMSLRSPGLRCLRAPPPAGRPRCRDQCGTEPAVQDQLRPGQFAGTLTIAYPDASTRRNGPDRPLAAKRPPSKLSPMQLCRPRSAKTRRLRSEKAEPSAYPLAAGTFGIGMTEFVIMGLLQQVSVSIAG